jgi:hypothetical protein
MNSLSVFGDRDRRHRLEVLQRVERHLHQARADHVRGEHHQERVAVGRRLGDLLGADHGVGPRPVLDDHRLLERFRKPRRHGARHDVGRAALVGNDDAHRLVGISLRMQRRREEKCDERKAESDHVTSPGK